MSIVAVYCRLSVDLVYISTLILTLMCRLQQFVDTAATQRGLEFQSARFTATHLSFLGRRKHPRRRQRMQ